MSGPVVGAEARAITFTGAEMRGGVDGPGCMPSCVLDLLGDLLALRPEAGARLLLAGPHHDAVALRLADAGYRVQLQLRGLVDAEAVAARLPSTIDVRCGTLRGTTDSYAAVIALGGVEYLTTGDAPVDGWADAIELLAGLVAPGGLLAVTVRNGFGLDRLTSSVAGVAGHRRDTYAADRPGVDRRLAEAGLRAEVAYALYPDPAAPEIMVHGDAYAAGGDVLGTLIAAAYRDGVDDPHRLTDPRRVARESVAYGVGEALAPGWLIVARRPPSGDTSGATMTTGVLVADGRGDEFRSAPYIAVAAPDGTWSRRRVLGGDEARYAGLVRDPTRLDGGLPGGALLEERFTEAAGDHDMAGLRELVGRFAAWLGVPVEEVTASISDADPISDDRAVAMLDNVVDDGVALRTFDPSWAADPAVPAEVVFVAALYRFATRLLAGALPHPWVAAESPGKLGARLASMIGLVVTPELLEAAAGWAERAGSAMGGRPIEEAPAEPWAPPRVQPLDVVVGPVDPIAPIVRPRGLAEATRTIEAISAELAGTHEQLGLLTSTIADLDKRLAKAVRRAARIEGSRIYQAARVVAGPLRAARKAVRRSRKH